MPPSLPSCNTGVVEAQVTDVEDSVSSVVRPDGNMGLGFEPNLLRFIVYKFVSGIRLYLKISWWLQN